MKINCSTLAEECRYSFRQEHVLLFVSFFAVVFQFIVLFMKPSLNNFLDKAKALTNSRLAMWL